MSEPSNLICHVGTARMGYRGRTGECVLDTTIKSGSGLGAVFAPTWELVMAYKRGAIGWEVYREQYRDLMRQHYRQQPTAFVKALQRERLTLCCYCKDTHATTRQCHRYLLVEILEKIAQYHGIGFASVGELSNRRV